MISANLLLEKCFDNKKGICPSMPTRERHLPTLLVDNVYMVRALIDVYHWTTDRRFLCYAELIAASMMQNLWSDEDGFLDRPIKEADTGMLKTPYSPFDENAIAADGFLRLNYLAGNEIYLEKAQAILNRLFHIYQNFGILASSYGLAVELHLYPVQVHIVGSRENPFQQYVDAALKMYNPLKTIEVVDPKTDGERLEALKYPFDGKVAAYVCAEEKCNLAKNIEDLTKLLNNKTDRSES